MLRAKSKQRIGKRTFYRNDPVIYFDTLTTSSLEGAATTNYANGGPGNARLLAWEGERTMTFNMTDALMSPESFMILSGAGLIEASPNSGDGEGTVYVHTTSQVQATENNTIVIPKVACWSHSGEITSDYYHDGADIFVMVLEDGEITNEPCIPAEAGVQHLFKKDEQDQYVLDSDGKKIPYATQIICDNHGRGIPKGAVVLVDYYVKRTAGVKQIEITPDKFGGYFYLEGSTLFRRESDGADLPAELVIPKVKIQSNFTFTMASTGDPSTFDFVMDAFPDYTKFDGTKKVLAVLQVIESESDDDAGEDFARREHCNNAADALATEVTSDEGFDHWKTYGERNQYATEDSGEYVNPNYPDADDEMGTKLYTITVTAPTGKVGAVRAKNSSGAIVAKSKAGAQLYVETDVANPKITGQYTDDEGHTQVLTISNSSIFTMPAYNVSIQITTN